MMNEAITEALKLVRITNKNQKPLFCVIFISLPSYSGISKMTSLVNKKSYQFEGKLKAN